MRVLDLIRAKDRLPERETDQSA